MGRRISDGRKRRHHDGCGRKKENKAKRENLIFNDAQAVQRYRDEEKERRSCLRSSAPLFLSVLRVLLRWLLLRSVGPLPAAVRVRPTVVCVGVSAVCLSQPHRSASSQPSDSLELATQQPCPTITTTICCRPSQDRPRRVDSTSRRETAGQTSKISQPSLGCACADHCRFDCSMQQQLIGALSVVCFALSVCGRSSYSYPSRSDESSSTSAAHPPMTYSQSLMHSQSAAQTASHSATSASPPHDGGQGAAQHSPSQQRPASQMSGSGAAEAQRSPSPFAAALAASAGSSGGAALPNAGPLPAAAAGIRSFVESTAHTLSLRVVGDPRSAAAGVAVV